MTTVLFIGGSGRSGSTLLERLVGQLPGVVALGEVVHLWDRGVRDDDLCGCGERFSGCAWWQEVGDRAYGGWDFADVDRVATLRRRLDRLRHTPRLAADTSAGFSRDLAEYADHFARVHGAAARAAGADVVVDSSKHASTALALARGGRVDLRVLQIVRDPRGVAHSWGKEVRRPETDDGRLMPRYSPGRSSALWLAHNAALAALGRRADGYARIRYEDLVAAPAATVLAAWRTLGLPGEGVLRTADDGSIDLARSHSVAGNPMRFRVGPTEIRPDQAWRTALPARDRRTATAVALPLMGPLGYLRRTS